MKRFLCLTLFFLATFTSFAQTQQGIVKTRGRMVNGQLVPGTRLSGAAITLSIGNPLVSGNQGSFSFNVPSGKNYSLVAAKKQGYTLADPEYTRRSFKYSASSPFYVVLEDENQRRADINAATKNVRRTLTAQLQAREDEIESLKEQNKLSEEEYQKRLQELYDNLSKSEQLVKEMAERYASTDYDQLDEFNRQVQLYIEEGELQKADSMIRSKGNMEQRVAEYHQAVAANKQEREELNRREQKLEQSEAGAAKTHEDLAQDLYRRHEIFLQEFKQDSALYCLKLRADLDTTNVDAVWTYASLCYDQKKFSECEKYYHICLRACTSIHDLSNIAATQNNLGNLYSDLHDYSNSEKYYKLALENYEHLFKDNPDAYRAYLAMTQNNLGVLYSNLRDYSNSEKYYKQALENYEHLFKDNPDAYRADLAGTQNNLGGLYSDLHDYPNSEKYYKLALENYEHLFKDNPDAYRAKLAAIQNNLGALYSDLHDYPNSEKYYKQALENYEHLFKDNPDAYRADLAMTQNNLGNLYYYLHDYSNSEKYYKQALENKEQLFKDNPDAYRADLALTQNNLGNLYSDLQDYSNSEKYYKQALENREHLFKDNPDAYRADLAGTQYNLGILYYNLHDYSNSEKYYKQALENREHLFKDNPDAYRSDLAGTQNNLGGLYYNLHDYSNSEKYYKLALENKEHLFKDNPDAYRASLASTYWNCMLLYGDMGDMDKYEATLAMALEQYKVLYASQPSVYATYVIKLQNRTVWRMLIKGSVDEAMALAKEAFAMDETNENSKSYLARCYNSKAYLYAQNNQFSEAYQSIDKAIGLTPTNADLYASKGEIFLMQGKDQEALKMWKKVLELNPDFLNDYPEGTNLSNGLKERGLIK